MSYETHLKDQKKKHNAEAEADIAQYEKDNAALKEQINASLDASAESQAEVYRQEIEQAPLDSRALYDQNAMREAVDRKKIEESLANMGMTDSGLTSSMQTALAVQKSRADSSVRAAERQRIRAAESTIDQIYANKELQKAQKGIEIDQDTAAYARTRRESANALATQTATSLHNAEVEAATAQYEASLAAEQEWMKQQLSGQQDTAKLRSDYVKLLMTREENPMDATKAWQEAYRAYPDTPVMSRAQYSYYTHYLNSGYPAEYANAMALACMNTANGTQEQTVEAVSDALVAQARKVAQKYGADRDTPAWSNDAAGVKKAMSETMQLIEGIEMPDEERMEVVAYLLGTAYSYHVFKSPNNPKLYQQIGEALEANLSGIYLEIALACAGLK